MARYFKNLPAHFSNLRTPKRVEELVSAVDTHLRCQQGLRKQQLQGSEGFDRLATATLQAVAGVGSMKDVKIVQVAVQNAGLVTEWQDVARRVLNLRAQGQAWPGLAQIL